MKKLSIGLMFCLLLSLFICPIAKAESDFRIIVDSNSTYVDSLILDGRTFIPVAQVANALGMGISWDADTEIVTLTKNDIVLTLQIGNKTLTTNKSTIQMDTSPQIIDGRTMLPCSWIVRAMGYSISLQNDGKALIINTQTTEQDKKTKIKQEVTEYINLQLNALKMLLNPSKSDVKLYMPKVTNFKLKLMSGVGEEYTNLEQLMRDMCDNMLSAFNALLEEGLIINNLDKAQIHLNKLDANFKLFSTEINRLKAEGLY